MSLRLLSVGLIGLLLFCSTPVQASTQMDAGKAFTKGIRGGVNIITGWVEIPKRVNETWTSSGAAAGFTWGLLRGLGYGFIRTAAGFYELFTFPFPAPPDYQPVISPAYVFTEEVEN